MDVAKATVTKSADGENPLSNKRVFSFAEFLLTDECRHIIGAEFVDRAVRSSVTITTLTSLTNYARQRYPSQYKDWRTPTAHEPYGRERMMLLWSAYLKVREQ